MSYRRNDPPWNILLVGVLVAAGGALLSTAACDQGKPAAPAGGAAPAPQGQKAPSAPKLKFEPETEDHSDLAVGETVVELIALRSETPVDWKTIGFTSSCDCLNVRFADTSDSKRAVVELTFEPHVLEDIDGVVDARDVSKEGLAKDSHGVVRARYTAKVIASRIPFVSPRGVVLAMGGSGHFELIVGQSFAPKADHPTSVFGDIHCDDAKLFFDIKDEEAAMTEENTLVQTRIPFDLSEDARAAPFTTKVKLKFGVPAVERTVEVQWK